MNIIYLNYIFDHRIYEHNLAAMKLKPEKNSGQNVIRTHDLYDTAVVLYQLSYLLGSAMALINIQNKFLCHHFIPAMLFKDL